MDLNIVVVNKYHGTTGEYIGRGSPLGNPFPIQPGSPRETVIEAYATWLSEKILNKDSKVINELDRLHQIAVLTGMVKLQCFCAPKPCHGDVIRKVIMTAHNNNSQEQPS